MAHSSPEPAALLFGSGWLVVPCVRCRDYSAAASMAGEGGEGLDLDGAGALGGEWRWMVGR